VIRLPNLDNIGRQKILKDCTVRQHQLIAIAFTKTGRVVSRETNKLGSGDVSDWSWHAEEALANKLFKTNAVRRNGDIYVLVARLGRSKGWTLAKPCPGCRWKLKISGVSAVFYTEDDGKIEKMVV
jgi:hypothetical protein